MFDLLFLLNKGQIFRSQVFVKVSRQKLTSPIPIRQNAPDYKGVAARHAKAPVA
jgi:hypothetical protein